MSRPDVVTIQWLACGQGLDKKEKLKRNYAVDPVSINSFIMDGQVSSFFLFLCGRPYKRNRNWMARTTSQFLNPGTSPKEKKKGRYLLCQDSRN
jgi:hypothetical protein